MENDNSLFSELFGDDEDSHPGEHKSENDSVSDDILKVLQDCIVRSKHLDGFTPLKEETHVPGLALYRRALNPDLCSRYFDWLSSEYFSQTPQLGLECSQEPRLNQGMHFGSLNDANTPFGYLAELSQTLQELLPAKLCQREVMFDQAIINLYDAGEGIGDHIDLLRFADGIVGFSFGSAATMRLRPVVDASDRERAAHYAEELHDTCASEVTIRLQPGDVYALSGDARMQWTHGFPAFVDGAANVSSRRISVTLRKLQDD
ncbi:hypothetical protein H4R20_001959 [Coemansia guatemalensis]|uniref:Fe2OG dioxygenase domain-containing protein n=1 Tax=Coemansia guatemalensis TaxID=2761395 RepID=A0A9W8I2B7_9FUNG|nr:hypothetical protein H4R20_001959 [Coemansia guatemalensis]